MARSLVEHWLLGSAGSLTGKYRPRFSEHGSGNDGLGVHPFRTHCWVLRKRTALGLPPSGGGLEACSSLPSVEDERRCSSFAGPAFHHIGSSLLRGSAGCLVMGLAWLLFVV
jgi:hypothetical protein